MTLGGAVLPSLPVGQSTSLRTASADAAQRPSVQEGPLALLIAQHR